MGVLWSEAPQHTHITLLNPPKGLGVSVGDASDWWGDDEELYENSPPSEAAALGGRMVVPVLLLEAALPS